MTTRVLDEHLLSLTQFLLLSIGYWIIFLTRSIYNQYADWVFRSCSCSSWALLRGVVPLLFALCRAHWLVSLSTLARYVRAWLEIFISIAIRFGLISSVLRWRVHKGRNSSVRRLSITSIYMRVWCVSMVTGVRYTRFMWCVANYFSNPQGAQRRGDYEK